MNNKRKFFRAIALAEGISFLTLLVIAMPLKYFWNMPEAVKIVGWAHGVLFTIYIPSVFLVKREMQWNFIQVIGALAASVIPFGTFVLDRFFIRKVEID